MRAPWRGEEGAELLTLIVNPVAAVGGLGRLKGGGRYSSPVSNAVDVARENGRVMPEHELLPALVPTEAEAGALTAARLAEVAHELRTPLGGVEAMATALCEADLPPESARMAQALLASAQHLRAVASALLDEHRRAETESADAPRAVDLDGLLAPILAAARSRAAAKGLAFSCRIGDGAPARPVLRRTAVRRMLENLLDNAFKATTCGHVELSVDRIARRRSVHELRFAVRDTGVGFAPERAETLFQPFAGDVSGAAGFGLSLVRSLATSMGGAAAAESRPGEGATVWFTLLAAGDAAPPPRAAPRRRDAELPADAPRILVVDDNGPSRTVLSVVLRQFGFAVEEASSGAEALARLPGGDFHAVMMDMTMDGLDGPATTRAIRSLACAAAKTPIIAVTGRVSAAEQRTFLDAGAGAVAPKPISPAAIWRALDALGLVQPRVSAA